MPVRCFWAEEASGGSVRDRVEMQWGRVVLPSVCSRCLHPLHDDQDRNRYKVETDLPGLAELGDPGRIVGFHAECDPET